MNPVLMLCRNNIHLTKKAVKSVLNQDIPVELFVIDNGSTDGTPEWARTQDVWYSYSDPPKSVAESWNFGLKKLFDSGAEFCLVVNNDTELRPDTYRHLLNDGGGFVTVVGTNDPEKIKPPYMDPDPGRKRRHPDFSAFLVRCEVYEKVGPFDECFKIAFVEDSSYHVRMHRAGITAYCLDLPFLHHGSMTIKNADPAEVRKIQIQAEKNRALFKSMYGFAVGSKEYYDSFGSTAPHE